jgi:hypothetical protein
MNLIIERFINNLDKEKVNSFALSKNIILSDEELDFTYEFVKKNYKTILSNPSLLNMDLYKNRFTNDNFIKINKLIDEYYTKYHSIIKNVF